MSFSIQAPLGIGISKSIKKNELRKVKIENKDYCLFRDSRGKLSLVDNVCPHRGADLSMGKVRNDCVQCPYHGWEFDSSGKLVKVPSTRGCLPKNGDIIAHNVIEDGGFVWLVTADNGPGLLPTAFCGELYDTGWEKVYGSRVMDGNVVDWIMNGTDISHINYVHDFANENDGLVTNIIVNTYDDLVQCFARVNSKASSNLTEHMQPIEGSEVVSTFIAPTTTTVRIKLRDPYEFITFTTLLPVDENRTQMSWCFMYPNRFPLNLPLVKMRFNNEMYKTVAQDERIIGCVSHLGSGYKLNVPCDMFQLEVLKKLPWKP